MIVSRNGRLLELGGHYAALAAREADAVEEALA